jgi:hypothetical protein
MDIISKLKLKSSCFKLWFQGFILKTTFSLFQYREYIHMSEKSNMSELEVAYIEPLWEKYGNDWAAMWRDKKNYNQLTREKLRRRCERYQEWLVIQQEKVDEDNESDEEDDEE